MGLLTPDYCLPSRSPSLLERPTKDRSKYITFDVPDRAGTPIERSDKPCEVTALDFIDNSWVFGRGRRSLAHADCQSIRKFVFDWTVQDICPYNSRAMARRGLDHNYQLGHFGV
jgi:hypothetical protein